MATAAGPALPLQLPRPASTDDIPGGNRVDGSLFVSTFMAPQSKRKQLLAAGISHIVNCTDNFPCKYPADFAYLQIGGLLDQNNMDYISSFDTIVAFIADAVDAGGRVLVHCASGHSRSGTAALAYIMARCAGGRRRCSSAGLMLLH